jgi:hypothetical protein
MAVLTKAPRETPVPGRLALRGRELRNVIAETARMQYAELMRLVDAAYATEVDPLKAVKMPRGLERIIDGIRNIFGNVIGKIWDRLGDVWRRYFGKGGQQGINDVRQGLSRQGATMVVPDFSLETPFARQMIRRMPIELAEYINGQRRENVRGLIERVRREIERGIIQGDGYKEIAKRISDHFVEETGYRAERIAITETQRAINAGTLEAYRQSGVVVGKRWLLSGAPCPLCVALAEETEDRFVGLNESFTTNPDAPPGYQDIQAPPLHPNCQCSLMAVMASELVSVPAQDAA